MAKWWKRKLLTQVELVPTSTDGAEAKARSELALQAAVDQHSAASEMGVQFEFYNERNHYMTRVKKAWGAPDV